MARFELGNEFGVSCFELVRVDVFYEDLIEGHPGKPTGHGLRPVVADRPEHPASGLADKHNFPAIGEEINPATQDLGDIGKVFQFHTFDASRFAAIVKCQKSPTNIFYWDLGDDEDG